MRFLALIGLCAACSSSAPPDLHVGGVISLPAPCGYDVHTHDGASRPAPSSGQLGADPTPKLVHLTVPNDPSTTTAVLWRTNDNTTLATQVQFGTGGATDKTASGFTFVYDVAGADAVRMHETHLCGLTPDTEYSYRVGGAAGGKESWSPVYTFRTAPSRAASPDAEVVLLVIGDTREGYDVWGQSLKTAFGIAVPDYVLFSGDSIPLGLVQDDWDTWFAAADPLLAQAPMIYAHGNHEANSVNFFSQLALPGDEQNFAVDIGAMHLTVANDSPQNDADLTGANAQLLDAHLKAAAGAPWSVLLSHRAFWSAAQGPHPEDATAIRAAWLSYVDNNQVNLVLNGHDHDYERTQPLRNMKTGSGTIYVVVGSAGAPLYDSGTDFWTAFSKSTYSFMIARVRATTIELTAYAPDGTRIDSLLIAK